MHKFQSDKCLFYLLNSETDSEHVMVQVVSSLHFFGHGNVIPLADQLITMFSFLVNAFSIEQSAKRKKSK
jgi:hypothetical protein